MALPARESLNGGYQAIRDYFNVMSVEPHRQVVFFEGECFNVYSFTRAADAEAFMRQFNGVKFDPKRDSKMSALFES